MIFSSNPFDLNLSVDALSPSHMAVLPDSNLTSELIDPLQTVISASSFDGSFEPNNSPSSAYEVGVLGKASRVFRSNLDPDLDVQDFYHFRLETASNFKLSLSGLDVNLGVSLLQVGDTGLPFSIAESSRPGTQAEEIQIRGLAAGDYYVLINQTEPVSGPPLRRNYSYILRMSAPAGVLRDREPNNSLEAGQDLGTIAGARQLKGSASTGSPADFYRLNIHGTSHVQFNLTDTAAAAAIDIIRDSNSNGAIDDGEVVYSGVPAGQSVGSFELNGLSGEYFIYIHPAPQDVANQRLRFNYTLDINVLPATLEIVERNDTIDQSTDLGLLSQPFQVRTVVGGPHTYSGIFPIWPDRYDFYRFNLDTTSNVSIGLDILPFPAGDGLPVELSLLRDVNDDGVVDPGEIIVQSMSPAQLDVQGLGAGTYYVRVFREFIASRLRDGSVYDLTLSSTPGAGTSTSPNNTLSEASSIGTLNGYRQFSGRIVDGAMLPSRNNQDYYRFELGTTSNIDLTLNLEYFLPILPQFIDYPPILVQLIQDTNSNGILDSGELLSQALAGLGDYETGETTTGYISLSGLATGSYFVGVVREPNYPPGRREGPANYVLDLVATFV